MNTGINVNVDRQRVWDGSHARAILKNEYYVAEQRFETTMGKLKRKLPKSRAKRFKILGAALKESLQPCLIEANFGPLPRHGKRDCFSFLTLERFSHSMEQRELFKSRRVVPCWLTIVDPKGMNVHDFYSSCLVSEHALERLIRRSQCHSIQEIIAVAQRYLLAVLDKEVSGVLGDMSEFIVVGPDGYMPCRRSEEDSTPIILSWIPRNLWTPQQEAKLTLLSDRCEENNEITVVDGAAFNGSCFLDPALY
jgi:hypothetical protein